MHHLISISILNSWLDDFRRNFSKESGVSANLFSGLT
jgi:hypothetical protein